MACLPCQQQRAAFVGAVRRFDLRGATQAVRTAGSIVADKLRGVDVNAKYGGVIKATPYRRPPQRNV